MKQVCDEIAQQRKTRIKSYQRKPNGRLVSGATRIHGLHGDPENFSTDLKVARSPRSSNNNLLLQIYTETTKRQANNYHKHYHR